jgi:serine/threonine protein kinase
MLSHYRLIDKIGEGGMGVVYSAEDTKLNRKVALKVLPQKLADNPDRRMRFEREAKAVAALNHPHIVTLHSVEEQDGLHFITMELVEGKPLARMLSRGGLALDRIFELMFPLIDAVSVAHEHGITHRDLKPDNVMVRDDGRIKILDFGLAKMLEVPGGSDERATHLPTATATGEGRILGTVAYMSPEQTQGKSVDHRTDIFALGVMLFEMASGQRPFSGDTGISIISSIIKDTPPIVTDLNRALPRHFGRIIRRCLEKDPDRRYQRARDLLTELEDLKREMATEGSDVEMAPSSVPTKKRSVVPWLAATAVVVLGALALFQLVGRGDAGDASATPAVLEVRTASVAAIRAPTPTTSTSATALPTS